MGERNPRARREVTIQNEPFVLLKVCNLLSSLTEDTANFVLLLNYNTHKLTHYNQLRFSDCCGTILWIMDPTLLYSLGDQPGSTPAAGSTCSSQLAALQQNKESCQLEKRAAGEAADGYQGQPQS